MKLWRTGTAHNNLRTGQKKGYGKRPLWQWILLYIIVGGLIYFAIYYFYFRNNTSLYGNSSSQTQSTPNSNNVPAVNNAILSTKKDSKLGQYLTDASGHPLYTYGETRTVSVTVPVLVSPLGQPTKIPAPQQDYQVASALLSVQTTDRRSLRIMECLSTPSQATAAIKSLATG